jgi:hypothetical protein
VEERLFKKHLQFYPPKGSGEKKRSLCLGDFSQGPDVFAEAFNRYYARHLMMKAHNAE